MLSHVQVVLLFLSLHSFLKTEDLLPPCGLQLGDGDIIELSVFASVQPFKFVLLTGFDLSFCRWL